MSNKQTKIKNLINNRLKGRKNRQAEKVEEQPRKHNSQSSQQPPNTTYIIRTGFDDKLKAEIKEELDKIMDEIKAQRKEVKEQRESIQEILRIAKANLILTNQLLAKQIISTVQTENERTKTKNMEEQKQCKSHNTAHTKNVNGKENMPQVQEVNAENLTKNKPSTKTEMHQNSGKRKRRIYSWELETEQNIPNKHFKADTDRVKEEPGKFLESQIDIKHESSNKDPLEVKSSFFDLNGLDELFQTQSNFEAESKPAKIHLVPQNKLTGENIPKTQFNVQKTNCGRFKSEALRTNLYNFTGFQTNSYPTSTPQMLYGNYINMQNCSSHTNQHMRPTESMQAMTPLQERYQQNVNNFLPKYAYHSWMQQTNV